MDSSLHDTECLCLDIISSPASLTFRVSGNNIYTFRAVHDSRATASVSPINGSKFLLSHSRAIPLATDACSLHALYTFTGVSLSILSLGRDYAVPILSLGSVGVEFPGSLYLYTRPGEVASLPSSLDMDIPRWFILLDPFVLSVFLPPRVVQIYLGQGRGRDRVLHHLFWSHRTHSRR